MSDEDLHSLGTSTFLLGGITRLTCCAGSASVSALVPGFNDADVVPRLVPGFNDAEEVPRLVPGLNDAEVVPR